MKVVDINQIFTSQYVQRCCTKSYLRENQSDRFVLSTIWTRTIELARWIRQTRKYIDRTDQRLCTSLFNVLVSIGDIQKYELFDFRAQQH
jgi:hypothetical protein